MGITEFDERGSFNAVCGFLRSLGARWYRPDSLGEIIPEMKSIPLPKIDKTVTPDFPFRYPYCFGGRFSQAPMDYLLWQLRLGVNQAPDLIMAGNLGHGIIRVHMRPEIREAHPEYFMLFKGKRMTDTRHGVPCLSSEELIDQNARYVRAVFDQFDEPMVSVMPGDGFGSMCNCPLCEGKGTPERGWFGQLSDYVWAYVNAVAEKVRETHPDRKILCNAYSTYLLPPTKIDTLSPNLAVGICQLRADQSRMEMMRELRQQWLEKLPEGEKRLTTYDYFLEPWRKQLRGLPAYYPKAVADDIRSLKGISSGEFSEVLPEGPAILNLYVAARSWWDADQDVAALIDEYCRLYFGPAADKMKAFIEFSEENWRKMKVDVVPIDEAFEMIAEAQKAAGTDNVYRKRVDLVADYMEPMKKLKEKLSIGRGEVPVAKAGRREKKDLKLDGKLEDVFWKDLPEYELKDLTTGKKPKFPGRFKMAIAGDDLCFAIRCDDPDAANLNVNATKDGDPNVWYGDNVEVLVETPIHSYYQIVVNPAGAIVDADRKDGITILWESSAQAVATVDENGWSVELRLPAGGDMIQIIDKLNGIAGDVPSAEKPWHFNVCRQRDRNGKMEHTAFSPTGSTSFHDKLKFGKLTVE